MTDQLTFSGQYAYGIVEDIDDPMEIGRVQVRLFGIHNPNKKILPTKNLPWCQILLPVTGNEASSHGIRKGNCVKCSFLDGVEMQIPIVEGILPGIVDEGSKSILGLSDKTLSKYADGRNITKKQKIDPSQPEDPYNAKYPFNHVFETESGHRIEVDDTPGAERVHIFHKSGTNVEMHPDGTIVTSVQKDEFVVVKKDSTTVIKGNSETKVEGNNSITVEGNIKVTCNGNIEIESTGEAKITSAAKIEIVSVGDIDITSGGNVNITAAGLINLR